MALMDIFVGTAGLFWGLLAVLFLIFWIFQLVHTIQKKRYLWFILVLLIPILAIVYYFVRGAKKSKWGL